MIFGLTTGYIVITVFLIFILIMLAGTFNAPAIFVIPIGLILIFGTSAEFITHLVSDNILGISIMLLLVYWWFK